MEKIYGFVSITVHEGRTDAFVTAARACHEAILPDITGTHYYEWYLSADGQQAYVIEVYDDPPAMALHGKMLDGRVSGVMEQADLRISFAGDVPDAVRERMRLKLGTVDYVGPRAFGRMNEPVPHRVPPAGDERVCALAWFRPHAGKAEAFRELARQSHERACERDPGTLGYEWFFDPDGNCVALDVYRDPDAMLAHMGNCGPVMGQILQVADSRTIVFGALPPQIEGRLRPELGITRFPRRLHGIG
ncbi:antibiotic biosynthesis monooxygenase [Sphingobium sp. EM0848]|uniref:antibiotic biosynthesis monooxygenase n=1 Tax=Sphingobium sp. EM0848 TaxID=2743473 RepID=UPI00159BF0EB|nr:antibiotic biosynthesis monooxygenase [Sphingobium sp. EM0848]